ncbi:MAG: methyl-accepting chemotaxis protein [Minwuiales bacterium]|nr:methyl-accepting chemotaxis protein [Minwuiales bacterium]
MTNGFSLVSAQAASAGALLATSGLAVFLIATGGFSIAAVVLACVAIAAGFGALYLQWRTDRSIARALAVCRAAAQGDFETRVIGIRESGNLGELMWSVNEMIDRSDAFVREARASMQYVSANKYFRRIIEKGMIGCFGQSSRVINAATDATAAKVREFSAVADAFEKNVYQVVETIASAAVELQSSAQSMEAVATATTERATAVAAASEKASNNVQVVAAAAEELFASIQEISRQVSHSTERARNAVERSANSKSQVEGLTEAAQKVGEVVKLIEEIAEQTNLLALNATIEAARAGEAGKGFAVVAAEVKGLSTQTARATDEIAGQIGSMQSVSDDANMAMQEIGETVSGIDESVGAIAAAIEQQGAATKEIATNVEQASAGTRQVAENIGSVTEAATETRESAGQVLGAAAELAAQADRMKAEVGDFLTRARSVA